MNPGVDFVVVRTVDGAEVVAAEETTGSLVVVGLVDLT